MPPNWFFPPLRPRRYFRAAEIRYLARFRGKYFFHWLFIWIKKMGQRKFQAIANSRKLQCEHHLVADLFVCGIFLLAWDAGLPGRRGRRPLRACEKFLLAGL